MGHPSELPNCFKLQIYCADGDDLGEDRLRGRQAHFSMRDEGEFCLRMSNGFGFPLSVRVGLSIGENDKVSFRVPQCPVLTMQQHVATVDLASHQDDTEKSVQTVRWPLEFPPNPSAKATIGITLRLNTIQLYRHHEITVNFK